MFTARTAKGCDRPVIAYVRPEIPRVTYLDEQGDVIPYGSRWGMESPPDDSYSRTSHLERFAPLHTVANALIEWLRDAFDVDVVDDVAVASDMTFSPRDVVRAVRVTPRSPDAAPLTFALTSFPGTYLHLGTLHDCFFPVCGCDACDDDVEELADDLEWTVRTVIGGGFGEHIDSASASFTYSLDEPGVGSRSGSGNADDLPPGRIEEARNRLPHDGQWAPWPVQN